MTRYPYPYTYAQNGQVERKHKYIIKVGLSLHAQAHMCMQYWREAFNSAVFLINMLPIVVLNCYNPY